MEIEVVCGKIYNPDTGVRGTDFDGYKRVRRAPGPVDVVVVGRFTHRA